MCKIDKENCFTQFQHERQNIANAEKMKKIYGVQSNDNGRIESYFNSIKRNEIENRSSFNLLKREKKRNENGNKKMLSRGIHNINGMMKGNKLENQLSFCVSFAINFEEQRNVH